MLRAGVNTLSYTASATRDDIQAPLGQIARGQSKGRLRHLESLRKLISYSHARRDLRVEIPVPSWLPKIGSAKEMRIWISCDFDASMGMTTPLGTDGHARQGFMIYMGSQQRSSILCAWQVYATGHDCSFHLRSGVDFLQLCNKERGGIGECAEALRHRFEH